MSSKSWYCENCGDYIGESGEHAGYMDFNPPNNSVWYHKGGFLGVGGSLHVFCSDRCKHEWKENNDND